MIQRPVKSLVDLAIYVYREFMVTPVADRFSGSNSATAYKPV